MWFVHRLIRSGYALAHQTGVFSTGVGRSAYEYWYEKYKLSSESIAIAELCRDITPGSLAIDVGANIGIYSSAFAKRVSQGGMVIALEPEPDNLRSLRKRFSSLQSPVKIVDAAASDRVGTIKLHRDLYNPAGHVISDHGIEVRSVRLDDLVGQQALPVSVIKIDVEGAEPLVLRGAQLTIDRYRPTILLEYSPSAIAAFHQDPRAILNDMSARNYDFYIPGQSTRLSIAEIENATKLRSYVDVLLRPRLRGGPA
jgi:FkbM family methyltransferase